MKLNESFELFDKELRKSCEGWAEIKSTYMIDYNGKLYPLEKIASIANGLPSSVLVEEEEAIQYSINNELKIVLSSFPTKMRLQNAMDRFDKEMREDFEKHNWIGGGTYKLAIWDKNRYYPLFKILEIAINSRTDLIDTNYIMKKLKSQGFIIIPIPIPEVSRNKIVEVISLLDNQYTKLKKSPNWGDDNDIKYALLYKNKIYPTRDVLSIAFGRDIDPSISEEWIIYLLKENGFHIALRKIPERTREQLTDAIIKLDKYYKEGKEIDESQNDYAIVYNNKYYPTNEIIKICALIPNIVSIHQDSLNKYFIERGFKVVLFRLPDPTIDEIKNAIRKFDEESRKDRKLEDFADCGDSCFIEHNGKYYPTKEIICLATGIDSIFIPSDVWLNALLCEKGFSIVNI